MTTRALVDVDLDVIAGIEQPSLQLWTTIKAPTQLPFAASFIVVGIATLTILIAEAAFTVPCSMFQ